VQLSLCREENEHTIFMQRSRCSVGSVRPELDDQPQKGGCVMRTNKLLVAALATFVSSSVFAQSIFFYGNYTATPGSGTQVIPFPLRFTPAPDLPNLPSIGGGTWRVEFDIRYVDLRVTNAAGATRLASQAPADGSILSWTLFVQAGPGLSGTFAAGVKKVSANVVQFVVSVLPLAPDNTVPGSGYFEPFFRNRNATKVLPELIVNWDAICNDFGIGNPYRLRDFGSFAWQLNEEGTSMASFPAISDGSFTCVPEPASMIALGSGLVGLLALRRRRSN
jgi:hypothetical protein